MWRVTREDPDGTTELIGFADDQSEIGVMIDEDRQLIDWEPVYRVVKE